jgi:hypothetical protein
MKPADILLWELFLDKYPNVYDECIYDFPLGTGATIPGETQENIAQDYKVLTQWKADVVAFRGGFVDVIEVKPNAGISTIGQVKAYAQLYDELDESTMPVAPVILTNVIRPDMERLCKLSGVRLVVV